MARKWKWTATSKELPPVNTDVVLIEEGSIYPRVGWYTAQGVWYYWYKDGAGLVVKRPVECWMPLPDTLPSGRVI